MANEGNRTAISLVLRLLREPAVDGRMVGQAEVVGTGELVTLQEPAELLDLVRRLAVDDGT
jgi:hypothetical protein